MRFFYGGFVASLLVSCGTHLPESELQTNRSAAAPERQEGIRQYQGIVHSYDGQVAFDVTVRAGAGVSEEAARRLLSEMVIAEVPEEMAKPIAPRSAPSGLDFGACDTLAAVTLAAADESVDVARYAWSWPEDFEPAEMTGVLRVVGSTCDVPEDSGALRWKWKWYGGNLMLERGEACAAVVGGGPAMLIVGSAVPPPWNLIAVAAIAAHDAIIFRRIGERGVRLEFNWSGTIHNIVTRPEGSKPLSGGWSKCSDYVTFCTNDVCMCEDAPDPILCQCQLDGEVDDC